MDRSGAPAPRPAAPRPRRPCARWRASCAQPWATPGPTPPPRRRPTPGAPQGMQARAWTQRPPLQAKLVAQQRRAAERGPAQRPWPRWSRWRGRRPTPRPLGPAPLGAMRQAGSLLLSSHARSRTGTLGAPMPRAARRPRRGARHLQNPRQGSQEGSASSGTRRGAPQARSAWGRSWPRRCRRCARTPAPPCAPHWPKVLCHLYSASIALECPAMPVTTCCSAHVAPAAPLCMCFAFLHSHTVLQPVCSALFALMRALGDATVLTLPQGMQPSAKPLTEYTGFFAAKPSLSKSH